MNLTPTLYKLIIVFGVTLGTVFCIKYVSHKPQDISRFPELDMAGDSIIYFIGSSRVRRSVDPDILEDCLKYKKVVNLGLRGSTFLSNSLIVEEIVKQNSPNAIVIELSPIRLNFSTESKLVFSMLDIDFDEKMRSTPYADESFPKNWTIRNPDLFSCLIE